MVRDDRVVLLGEDIADPVGGLFTCTAGLSTRFGAERVRATPIAETAIVGAAVGAATQGLRPVAEVMFLDFLTVCLDPLANHAAKWRFMSGGNTSVPLTVRTLEGAYSGAQHTQSLEAWLTHVPGLKVVYPSTPADAKGLLTSCIEDEDPCVFIESMAMMHAADRRGPVPEAEYRIPLGTADVKREGRDVTIVSWGSMVHSALLAAVELEGAGISAEVVDLRSLVPLDLETIQASVAKTKRLAIAHSATGFGGFGAEIAALVGRALLRRAGRPDPSDHRRLYAGAAFRGARGRAYAAARDDHRRGARDAGMTEIRIPKPGDAVMEGTLAEWLVADGTTVAQGDAIYLLETDKVEMQIEAPCAGVIRQIGVPGETYPVGELVATIA